MAKMPFFMRFVERQDKQEKVEEAQSIQTGVKAGAEDGAGARERKPWEKAPETMKWPSDGDDCIYW